MNIFFQKDNVKIQLEHFYRNPPVLVDIDNKIYASRIKTIQEILHYFILNPEKWDESCQYCIFSIGEEFLNALTEATSNVDEAQKRGIDRSYVFLYRFIIEFEIGLSSDKELGATLVEFRSKIESDKDEMVPPGRNIIERSHSYMISSIMRYYLNSEGIKSIKEFNSKIDAASKWNESLIKHEAEVGRLEKALEEQRYKYNFVGLHRGFSKLAKRKRIEKWFSLISLMIMGMIILIPLSLKFVILIEGHNGINNERLGQGNILSNDAAAKMEKEGIKESFIKQYDDYKRRIEESAQLPLFLTVLAIEILLIYYFRIILFNYKSVKAQLLQIEIRMTLCEFIQNYAEYSARIKKDNDGALEKFEKLIFSGIAVEESKIPTTFDGLEQIGNSLKALK